MFDLDGVVADLMKRYAAAVNATDSAAYRKLFTHDAVRSPPGVDLEVGPDAIANGEQADYDVYDFDIEMTRRDALALSDDYVFCFLEVHAKLTARDGGTSKNINALKSFLLERQPSGEWRREPPPPWRWPGICRHRRAGDGADHRRQNRSAPALAPCGR